MRDAKEILGRLETMRSARQPFERRWQDLSELTRPLRAEFGTKYKNGAAQGQARTSRVYDSTPAFAVENFSAGVYSMMTSPANKWFELQTVDADLMSYGPVKDWLDVVTERILSSFGPSVSKFYNVVPSLYADIACFGTGVFYTEEIEGQGRVLDSARPLAECFIAENEEEEVDTCYRDFSMSARAAVRKFGKDNLSASTVGIAERAPETRIPFVHAVEPNDDLTPGRIGPKGMAFRSVYIEPGGQKIVKESGYHDFPFMAPRWAVASGEEYGRGPGDLAHPDIRMLNAMKRATIIAAQKAADPPLLAPDEGVISVARNFPGGVTYGAVTQRGEQLVHPLQSGANFQISLEMMEQVRNSIRDAFFYSQLQLVGHPQRTLGEALIDEQNKLALMGPNLGRLQSEFLSKLIGRRYGMLLRAGQLPEAPEEMNGQTLKVHYVSPLAKAQKAGEANAVMQFVGGLGQIAQFDQGAIDKLDGDEAADVLAQGLGVPSKVVRGKDDVAQRRAVREQQLKMQQMLAAGQQVGGIAKDMGAAGKSGAEAQAAQQPPPEEKAA